MGKYFGRLIAFFLVGLLLPPIGALGILYTVFIMYSEFRRRLNDRGLDLSTDAASGWTVLHRIDKAGNPLEVDDFGDPIDIDDLPVTSSAPR